MKNVIVGQSGGPTSVINSSLLGVYKTAKDRGADIVYGMVHGIKGLLDGNIVDLSKQIRNDLDMDLLKRTPSSFLGSCRYKLPNIERNEDVYEKIFNELLDAMDYFHSKQIIHRDLKPSNILITNNGNNVKIIDFGLSDTDDYVILKQAAGTRKYAAPEQLSPNNIIDCRADIYSLGIILKNNFPKSYQKIADKCAQQDREKRFSSADEIRNYIKKKKITKTSIVISTILILLFALSFAITKHYISGKTYTINEKEILAEATQYIDAQIATLKIKIEEGPVSDVDEFNKISETYQNLISTDYMKWAKQIPSDTPFYNDFITYWNTYLSEKIKDILTPYTDWYRESFILTLNPEF